MIRPDDRTPAERFKDRIDSRDRDLARERLLDRKNSLMNNFGWGSFADRLNQQAIDSLDARIKELDQ